MRKSIALVLILSLAVLSFLGSSAWGEQIDYSNSHDLPMFLPNNQGEENVSEPMAELKPIFPSNGSGNSAPPARFGGARAPNKLAWMVGTFSTIQITAPMTIEPAVSGSVWAKGSGSGVFFYVNVYHNNNQIKQITTGTQSVSGDTEFPFSDSIDRTDMAPGDRLELRIYAGSEFNSNFEMCWGSLQYDSHIKIICNSMFVYVNPPVIVEDIVVFSAGIFDAFNSPQIDGHIQVIGKVDVLSLSAPRFMQGENGSMIAWDWDYKTDKAQDGEYMINIFVCYGDENDFVGHGRYELEFHKHAPPEDFISSLGIIFPIIIVAVIVVVIVVVVKVVLGRRAQKSAI
jgi:hypothetical protein